MSEQEKARGRMLSDRERNFRVSLRVLKYFDHVSLLQAGSFSSEIVTVKSRFPLWPLTPGDKETHYAKHLAYVNGLLVAEYKHLVGSDFQSLSRNDTEGETFLLYGRQRRQDLSLQIRQFDTKPDEVEIRLPHTDQGQVGQRVFSSWSELSGNDKAMLEGTFDIVV